MPWPPDLVTTGLIILGLIVIALVGWVIRLELRLKKLLGGREAKNLEALIVRLGEEVTNTNGVNQEIQNYLIEMEKRLKRSVQHVRTIRFNPFPDQGGRQSFVTALLDERGNGTVISSLYARDQVSVYAKPIINYQSEHDLSEEEVQAISHDEQ